MHIFIHLKCVGECIKNKKEVSKNSKTFHLETQDQFNYPSQMQRGLWMYSKVFKRVVLLDHLNFASTGFS